MPGPWPPTRRGFPTPAARCAGPTSLAITMGRPTAARSRIHDNQRSLNPYTRDASPAAAMPLTPPAGPAAPAAKTAYAHARMSPPRP